MISPCLAAGGKKRRNKKITGARAEAESGDFVHDERSGVVLFFAGRGNKLLLKKKKKTITANKKENKKHLLLRKNKKSTGAECHLRSRLWVLHPSCNNFRDQTHGSLTPFNFTNKKLSSVSNFCKNCGKGA